MIYNIHYDICALVISLFSIIFVIFRKGIRNKQNIILFVMILAAFLASFFDIASSVGNSYVDDYSYGIRDFMNYAYLISHNSLTFLFLRYVISLTGLDYKNRNKKWFAFKAAIPYVIILLLLGLNPVLHEVFYYDSDKIYSHGWGMYVLYGIAFLYFCLCYFVITKYGKSVSKPKKIMVYAFLTASLCAVALQIVIPHVLLQLCIESLCLLGVLFTVNNEDEIREFITTCYNRRAFIYDNTLYIKNKADYFIVTIKLPNLSYYTATMGVPTTNGFMRRIGEWLRKADSASTVYYCDNGHFSILCDSEEAMQKMQSAILRKFNEPWVSDGLMIRFQIQLWSAHIPKDINTLEHLLLIIDAPVQETGLQTGRKILEEEEVYGYKREIAVERAIENAIREKKFQVYYQPVCDVKADKVVSAEALIRLNDPELGFISPEEFIPIAEKKGYIVDIGEFVFENVCRFFKEKQLDKIGIEYIEVNLSTVQCMSEKLVKSFCDIVRKYDIKSNCINLEITESAMANNIAVLENTMKQLTSLGFTFSIDDFGTGYSNFNYIFDMPFSIVKLDKSILWKAAENERAGIILSNLIRMVNDMHMKTVAEGVETEEQKNTLKELGCDYLQGYYFSQAIPEEAFYKYCKEYNRIG